MSKRVKNYKGKPKGKYNAQFMRERARRFGSHTPLKPWVVAPDPFAGVLARLGGILRW